MTSSIPYSSANPRLCPTPLKSSSHLLRSNLLLSRLRTFLLPLLHSSIHQLRATLMNRSRRRVLKPLLLPKLFKNRSLSAVRHRTVRRMVFWVCRQNLCHSHDGANTDFPLRSRRLEMGRSRNGEEQYLPGNEYSLGKLVCWGWSSGHGAC